MPDLRKNRLISLFLVNVASGVVTVVVIFFGFLLSEKMGPLPPLLILAAVPAAAVGIWRSDLEQRVTSATRQSAWLGRRSGSSSPGRQSRSFLREPS